MKIVVKFGGSSLASAEQFKKVGKIIKKDEARKYVIPSAPGKRTPDDTKVTDLLDQAGLSYEIYSNIKANPTIENVQTGVAAFKKSGADYIIAIGGGSSMDTAKAIGIIIANPEFEDGNPRKESFLRVFHANCQKKEKFVEIETGFETGGS